MCNCLIHRYHVAHICACGEIIPHSQSAWDYHKGHGEMTTLDAMLYAHGDTPDTLRARVALAEFRQECREPRNYAPAFNSPADNGDWCVKDLKADDDPMWPHLAFDWYTRAGYAQHARACQMVAED